MLAGALSLGILPASFLALSQAHVASLESLNIHPFYGLLLAALGLLAAYWARRPTALSTAILGAACGASLLCRSAHLPLPFLLALYAIFRERSRKTGLKRAGILLACCGLAAAPWSARNFLRSGRFYALDLEAGAVNLYEASRGETAGATVMQAAEAAEAESPGFQALLAANPAAALAKLRGLAVRNIIAHPARYALGALPRLGLLLGPVKWLLLLGAYGLWRRRDAPASHSLALTAASLAMYAAVGIQVAYRDGTFPLAALLAGWGAAAVWRDMGAPELEKGLKLAPGLVVACAWLPFSLAYLAMLGLFAGEALARPDQARFARYIEMKVAASGGKEGLLQRAAAAGWSDSSCDDILRAPLDPQGDTETARRKAACLIREYGRRGDLEDAARRYAALIPLMEGEASHGAPDDAELWTARARLFLESGDAAGARAAAGKALASAGARPAIKRRALSARAAAGLAQGRAAEAAADARRLLALSPQDRAARLALVYALAGLGKDDEAEREAGRAAAGLESPDEERIAAPIEPEEDPGGSARAAAWIKAAAARRPDLPRLKFLAADAQARRSAEIKLRAVAAAGLMDDALRISRERESKLAPGSPEAIQERVKQARLMRRLGRPDEARDRLTREMRAIDAAGRLDESLRKSRDREAALAPGSPEAIEERLEQARLLLQLGRPDEARARLNADLELRGSPIERARIALVAAAADFAKGRAAAARNELLAAAAADPGTACAPPREGIDDGAAPPEFFTACLTARPGDPALLVGRGVGLYRAGKRGAALADFRRALELDPGNLPAALSLAAAGAEEGRAALQTALRRTRTRPDDPAYRQALETLGRAP